MNLNKFDRYARGRIAFDDGQILVGTIADYTSNLDNDGEGAYLLIIPESGDLKGKYVECPENEVKFAEYLE